MGQVLQFRRRMTSEEKLKELILHLLNRVGPMTHEELGAALWKIDSMAYIKTGKSITGCQYVKEC